MDLIISHAGCPDGWAAAYVCKMKYPEAEIMLLNHGLSEQALEEVFVASTGKDVVMVDYSLRTRELNDRLNSLAKSFQIYDHHKTARAVLDGAPYALFDMERSGVGLAWDYLFGATRPFWVDYTEDMDLWNWALPNSQEINAFLMVQPRIKEVWDALIRVHNATSAADAGIGVRQYIEYYTRSVVAEAQEGMLEGLKTAVLNIPYAGVSEAGNALCKTGYPIALCWFERGDGIIQFSLRGDGSVDVSAIAKSFGGGGHHNAAGFQLNLYEGRLLVDRVLSRTNLREPGGCIK